MALKQTDLDPTEPWSVDIQYPEGVVIYLPISVPCLFDPLPSVINCLNLDRFRFTLIKEHLVEFNQLAMANAEGSDNMLNRVMPKDNIGLAALLRTKEAAWDNGELNVTILNHYIRNFWHLFASQTRNESLRTTLP